MPIEIRPASADDEPAITQIRHETWLTAYAQIIDPEIISSLTASGRPPSTADRDGVVAVAPPGEASAEGRMIVGYASYGPERNVASSEPGALTPAGLAGETGELYTLYVTKAHWSTGVGRELTEAALDGLRAAGYRQIVLWTLTGNARARRFYDKAGFAPDGAVNLLPGLGGAEELRYRRDL